MPTSSSTIRISLAGVMSVRILRCRRAARENERDARAARRRVRELDAAVVLVDDLLHDREAEARALRLGRHVRLERAVRARRRETRARVAERERRPRRLARSSAIVVARVVRRRPGRRWRSAGGCGTPGAGGSARPGRRAGSGGSDNRTCGRRLSYSASTSSKRAPTSTGCIVPGRGWRA